MGVDAIVSLVSLLAPKAFDLMKGLFHRKDTPDQVLATLATTNPEAMAKYVEAQAKLVEAQNESVNADVTGTIPAWVSTIRALIRPTITIVGMAHIAINHIWDGPYEINDSAMYVYETAICSWFGSRMK
jgi:hypothetical protein